MKTITHILIVTFLIVTTNLVRAQEYFGTTSIGDTSIDINYRSAVNSQGEIFTLGLYSGTLTLGDATITWEGGNADGFLTRHDSNGTPLDIKGFGGFMDDVALDVAIDINDNIYITGYFTGAGPDSFDADPGPEEFLLMQPSPFASRDCFIIKLDPNGDFIWAKQVSNPAAVANEDSYSIEVDTDGNVYVGGRFAYADFDPSTDGEEIIISTGGGSSLDGFLLKLDTDGNYVWVKTFTSEGLVQINDMEFDANGDLLMIGDFEETVDLNPSETEDAEFTSNGARDTFMAKFTSDGEYLWAQTFGGAASEISKVIKSIDEDIYIGGMYTETTDLNPTDGVNEFTALGGYDGYLSKFNSNGDYQFSYTIGGDDTTNLEDVYSLRKNEATGNLFVTGTFLVTTDFDNSDNTAESTSNGNTDSYLLEIDTDGNYVNHWTIGGPLAEVNPQLEINENNEIITFGAFQGTDVDFNPFDEEDLISSIGSYDVYFSRFNTEPIAGIEESQLTNVVIYPNPTTGIIYIIDKNNIADSYEIYNVLGTKIATGTIQSQIDMSAFATGIYVLKVNSNTSSITRKIIKN
ncbi:T9SS type A sorting domain-containing protein [Cochleicola gelatinilyticus]|uniref:Secretion system C-terminal sorting domain-containing protein n=1 Tax=Cochleicola gelatinilyticus TaxID=1763537 RepID=A0A167GVV6_9FLAO|nr:T9SS type A sorting domain-containing protein [Cochleicola gelatinilyticus]OAB77957.1 hypothetical protein ULVI_10735 [Cochleicola gelatinilyticus]